MSVYLDIAFFINFLFDAEILFLLLKVASKKITYSRLFISALLGGLQGVFVFLPYFRILSLPPVSFLVSFFMVFVAVNPQSKKELFGSYIIFLMIAFFFGGAMTFFRLKAILGLLMILPLYFGLIKIRRKIFKKKINVTLVYKGKILERDAVYDSGNTVQYFGRPVIFGNKRLFYEIVGKKQIMPNEENATDFCLVPYKCVGKSGIAKGIRLDRAVVSDRNFDGAVFCCFEENLTDEVILNGIMI